MGKNRFDLFTLLMTVVGSLAGWGVTVAWIWDPMWASVITFGVALIVLTAFVLLKAEQKKNEYAERSTKQLLVAFEELFRVISESLGLLHEKHPELSAPPPSLLSKGPITQRSIQDFSVEVSTNLITLAERLGTEGCLSLTNCVHNHRFRTMEETLDTVLLKSEAFAELLESLVVMIVSNTHELTEPLSNEILVVKKDVSGFVRDLEAWRQSSRRKSDAEYQSVIQQFEVHTQKVTQISERIQSSRKDFRKNLDQVSNQFVRISERTQEISEISERVKMLSLNAAIEAARAGEAGRGFKVIAGEVQKLSVEVQTLVQGITAEISTTGQTLNTLLQRFDVESVQMGESLSSFNRELNAYDGDLAAYRKAFGDLVQTISAVSLDLEKHLDNLAPLFQLQDMTVQQVEHLSLMMENLRAENAMLLRPDSPFKQEVHKSVLALAEKLSTTDDELNVIRQLLQKHDLLPAQVPLQVSSSKSNIELF